MRTLRDIRLIAHSQRPPTSDIRKRAQPQDREKVIKIQQMSDENGIQPDLGVPGYKECRQLVTCCRVAIKIR